MAVTRKSATKSLKKTAKTVSKNAKSAVKRGKVAIKDAKAARSSVGRKLGKLVNAAKETEMKVMAGAKKAIRAGSKAAAVVAASEIVHDIQAGIARRKRNAKVKKAAKIVGGVVAAAAVTAAGVAAVRAQKK